MTQIGQYSTGSYDQLHTVDTYRRMVTRCRTYLDEVLPPQPSWGSNALMPPTDQRPLIVKQLQRSYAGSVAPVLDEVEPMFADLMSSLSAALNDTTRTNDYRQSASMVAVSSALAKATSIGQRLDTACSALLAKAEKAALPARPQPQDTAQEARLAGLKSDLQMLTSTVRSDPDGAVQAYVARLGAQLVHAVAAKDDLQVWLICSDWPTNILANAVGFDVNELKLLQAYWHDAIATALADGDLQTRAALDVHAALNDTNSGLPPLLVANAGFLSQVINQIADYVKRNTASVFAATN